MYKAAVIVAVASIQCVLNQNVATGDARGEFIFS